MSPVVPVRYRGGDPGSTDAKGWGGIRDEGHKATLHDS
ncbi:hypothetical protein CSE45_4698 [Citreicella sp. SE45]|nr:hypothetical protein CSE45_4698 [Citreicella sp. SE45]